MVGRGRCTQIAWVAAAVITALVPAGKGGRTAVRISRVMISARNATHPLTPGLRDLPRVPPNGGVTTSSDRDLHLWFNEPADPVNSQSTRAFICALDPRSPTDFAAYSLCNEEPQSANAPNGTNGVVRRYAVNSRFAEGRHTVYIRATVSQLSPPLSGRSCGALTGRSDVYTFCGPAMAYVFTVDTTPPLTTITGWHAPPLNQPALGTSWRGYATAASGGLPGFTAAQQLYTAQNSRPWAMGSPNPTYVSSTSFLAEFQASEGSLVGFMCRIDNGTAGPCDDRTIGHTGYLRDGQLGGVYFEGLISNGTLRPVGAPNTGPNTSAHLLEVWAIDAGGNVGPVATVAWVIDRDPPTTFIDRRDLFDGGARVSTATRFQIPFQSVDGGIFFECRVQCLQGVAGVPTGGGCDVAGGFAPCTSPAEVLLNDTILRQQRRGYVFSVRATDRAANSVECAVATDAVTSPGSHSCSSYAWTVDVSTPLTAVAVGFGGNTPQAGGCAGGVVLQTGRCLTNASMVSLSFTSTAAASEVSYECQLDSPIWFACGVGGDPRVTSPPSIQPYRTASPLVAGTELFIRLPDGAHYVRVRSTNTHGTTGPFVEIVWTSDTTAPSAFFTRTPSELTRSRGALFLFEVFPPEPRTRFQCSWDSRAYFPCDSGAVQVLDPTTGAGFGGNGSSSTAATWTAWTNAMHPATASTTGGGDVEVARCPMTIGETAVPVAIECRVAFTDVSWERANQTLATPCTLGGGLVCRNADQTGGGGCFDYEVRALCGQSPNSGLTVLVNAASSFTLFGDGVQLAQGADWTTTVEAQIPPDVQVLAIAAENTGDGSFGGVLLSLPTISVATNEFWRCLGLTNEEADPPAGWATSAYSTALWDDAIVKGFIGGPPWGNGYLGGYSSAPHRLQHLPFAKWIWARNSSTIGAPRRVFCRYDLRQSTNSNNAVVVTRTLSEGANSLYVRAVDEAGNVQPVPTHYEWEIDTIVPNAVFTYTPDNASNVTIPANHTWPSRVGSADAEFRFDTNNQGPQRFQGHLVKSRFQLSVDGAILTGFYCGAGTYLCGTTCRVIEVCDQNVHDGIALDPVNSSCSTELAGCDSGSRTSPFRLTNLAVTSHVILAAAIDMIGNVGPPARYSWVIDSSSPAVAVSQMSMPLAGSGGPTGEIRFAFSAIAVPGRFECIRRFRCAVSLRTSTVPSVRDWANCGAVPTVCNSTLEHTVRFTDISTSHPSAAQTAAMLNAITTSLPSGTSSAQLVRISAALQFPLERVYSGGSVAAPGRRLAWELNSSVSVIFNRTAPSREICLQICAEQLDCSALLYSTVTSNCVGLSAMVHQWALDRDGTSSYRRLRNRTTVNAVDLTFTVAISQPQYETDTVGDFTALIASGNFAETVQHEVAVGSAQASLRSNVSVFATIACIGFNDQRVHQLPQGVAALLSIAVARVSVSATATQTDGLYAEVSVIAPETTAASVRQSISTDVASGALFQELVRINSSMFDMWGVSTTLTVSSPQSLNWLTPQRAQHTILFAMHNIVTNGSVLTQSVSLTHFGEITVQPFTHPSFSTTFFATLRFSIGNTDRRFNESDARSIAATINTLQFRALLRSNASVHNAQFTQFAAPTIERVVDITGLAVLPESSAPQAVSIGDATVTMAVSDQQTSFYSNVSTVCHSGANSPPSACLADGRYNFMVRAEDTSGNVGNAATFAFEVDTALPLILWKRRPAAISNVQQGRVATFDFQSNEVDDAGLETARFVCGLLGAWTPGIDALLQDCGALPVSFFVTSGRYTFGVRAIDAAGNIGPLFTHHFEVDGDLPVAAIVGGVPPTFTTTENVVLRLNSSEPGTFWCSLEVGDCIINNTCGGGGTEAVAGHGNAPYSVCGSTVSVSALAQSVGAVAPSDRTSGDPPMLFRFRAILEDLAGNLQAVPAVALWTLDTSRPNVTIANGSKPFPLSAEPAPQLVFTPIDAMASRLTTAQHTSGRQSLALASYYAPPQTECLLLTNNDVTTYMAASPATRAVWGGWANCTSPFVVRVSTGTAMFMVRARSSTGLLGGNDSVQWTVDGAPPRLEARGAAGINTTQTANQVALAAQNGQPAPSNFSSSQASSRTPLSIVGGTAASAVGTLRVDILPNSSVVSSVELSAGPAHPRLRSVSLHSDSQVESNSTLWATGTLLADTSSVLIEGLRPATMSALLDDRVFVRVRTDLPQGTFNLYSQVRFRFNAYFEFYPQFTARTPAPNGQVSRMQCCIDGQCASRCHVCHGTGQPPVCATDCTTVAARNTTRCPCASVPRYTNWPVGYNSTSAGSVFSNSDGVPDVAWNHVGWDCGAGGRVLTGLRHGAHMLAARTVDKALRTSSTPMLHNWTYDLVPPLVGIVRVPPVVSSSEVSSGMYRSTERLSSISCEADWAGAATQCAAVGARGVTDHGDYSFSLDLTTRDGSHRLHVGGRDLAGNVAPRNSGIVWTVDTTAPNTSIVNVMSGFGSLQASVVTEPGATVDCTLSGLTADGENITINDCQGGVNASYCDLVSVYGFDGANADVNGVYRVRMCGNTPCEFNNRTTYSHVDQTILLYFVGNGWLLERRGAATAVARVLTSATRPDRTGTSQWVSSAGPVLPLVRVNSGACAGMCSTLVRYDGLPEGQYTLCVSAQDAAANVGQTTCMGPRAIESVGSVASARTAAALTDDSASARRTACDAARSEEVGFAIAAAIGFSIFAIAISLGIYAYRWRQASLVAAGQKAAAILSSTQGFSDAHFEGSRMDADMMF